MSDASNEARAASELSELVRGVSFLSLDAGGTVIFLDHARVARFVTAHGHPVTAEALVVSEGEAKRRLEVGKGGDPHAAPMVTVPFAGSDMPGAVSWGRMVATFLHLAGIPEAALSSLLGGLWLEHVKRNLWSLVPPGLGAALDAVRARGVRAVIVSNSEGMLVRLFEELGVLPHLDAVVDSGIVGVEKPDARIFELALEGHPPARALHLGDTFATDVAGAKNAGLRHALIDPYDHYAGMHVDVPRVAGVVQVCEALLATMR